MILQVGRDRVTLSDMVDIHGNLGVGPCRNGFPCRIKQMGETFRIGTHSGKKEGVGYEVHSKKSYVPVLTLLRKVIHTNFTVSL